MPTFAPMIKEQNTQLLPVMERFGTIQGEGTFTGWAAWFIRLGGCDVGCVWCDVKESWPVEGHPLMSPEDLATEASSFAGDVTVITGGEPLMYNLDELTQALHEQERQTHLETSGAYPLSGEWDWICVSPKKFKPALPQVLAAASELKVVVYHKSDFEWAEKQSEKVHEDCLLYLQPEWSKREELMPLIVEYVKNNPDWQISLQTHKYLNIP
jgi:7-carboxy-7-deazaguanine synthase